MWKKTRFLILSIIIILVILTVLLLMPLPFVFSRNTDIDINSGDERLQTVLFSFVIQEEIRQTLILWKN